MTALAQLKQGPLRRGRGGLPEELRQAAEESLQRDALLRAAILELCERVEDLEAGSGSGSSAARVVSFHSHCDRGSSTSLFYTSWGTTAEATAGGVDEEVMLLPPFGANSRIADVTILTEQAAGATDITVCEVDETVLETQSIGSLAAGAVETVTFDLDWSDGEPRIIGVDPTTAPQSVTLIVTIEEVTS